LWSIAMAKTKFGLSDADVAELRRIYLV
jgi:hypothetical protein